MFRLVGMGELLWDVKGSDARPGGAPANFAVHAAQLGAAAAVVSRVGTDEAGDGLVKVLRGRGVDVSGIERDPAAPTGRVDVTGEPPVYTIHEGVAWDNIAGDGVRLAADADAVCFGTLAQRAEPSRSSIQRLLKATRPDCLRVFDVNLRQHFHSPEALEASFELASVAKVNDAELVHLAGLFGLPAGEREAMTALARRWGLLAVACTRGERGSALLRGDLWSECPAVHCTVADTVGAGDSFTAAMVLGMLNGWPLDDVNRRAAAVAAAVCSQPGGMPVLPEKVRRPFLANGAT